MDVLNSWLPRMAMCDQAMRLAATHPRLKEVDEKLRDTLEAAAAAVQQRAYKLDDVVSEDYRAMDRSTALLFLEATERGNIILQALFDAMPLVMPEASSTRKLREAQDFVRKAQQRLGKLPVVAQIPVTWPAKAPAPATGGSAAEEGAEAEVRGHEGDGAAEPTPATRSACAAGILEGSTSVVSTPDHHLKLQVLLEASPEQKAEHQMARALNVMFLPADGSAPPPPLPPSEDDDEEEGGAAQDPVAKLYYSLTGPASGVLSRKLVASLLEPYYVLVDAADRAEAAVAHAAIHEPTEAVLAKALGASGASRQAVLTNRRQFKRWAPAVANMGLTVQLVLDGVAEAARRVDEELPPIVVPGQLEVLQEKEEAEDEEEM